MRLPRIYDYKIMRFLGITVSTLSQRFFSVARARAVAIQQHLWWWVKAFSSMVWPTFHLAACWLLAHPSYFIYRMSEISFSNTIFEYYIEHWTLTSIFPLASYKTIQNDFIHSTSTTIIIFNRFFNYKPSQYFMPLLSLRWFLDDSPQNEREHWQ